MRTEQINNEIQELRKINFENQELIGQLTKKIKIMLNN